jgi:hypothetical protein
MVITYIYKQYSANAWTKKNCEHEWQEYWDMRTTGYFMQGITRYCGPKIICKQYSIEWQNGLRLQNLPGKNQGHVYDRNRRTIQTLQYA